MIDRLLELKNNLVAKQKEQVRLNKLYLISVGNLKKLAEDDKMLTLLAKHGIIIPEQLL